MQHLQRDFNAFKNRGKWNGGFRPGVKKETRELLARNVRTPDNVFVRERVLLVQITTATRSKDRLV